MARQLLALALVQLAAAASTRSMICSFAPVPVLCSEPTASSTGCTGHDCCPSSSCLPTLMVSCSASRGQTECVGNSVFPIPKMGMCRCLSGVCTSSGTCRDISSSQSQVSGQRTTNQLSNTFGRAFEDHEPEEVPREDATVAVLLFGLVALFAPGFAAVTAVRAWRRRSENNKAVRSLEPLVSAGGPDSEELGVE